MNRPWTGGSSSGPLIIGQPGRPPLPSTSCPVPTQDGVGERLFRLATLTCTRIGLGTVLADIA